MLKTFKEKHKTGTIGCRLHFGDNSIQHDGVMICVDKEKRILVTHYNLKNYYNYTTGHRVGIGSTGALLGVRKNTFIKSNMFNEQYINCFEDVELNLNLITLGYENIYDGSLVAYHYESQTRNENPDNLKTLSEDYRNNLFPFISKNWESVKKYVEVVQ
jgi:GT2 family glycosyltransferase